jgi:hypothetical protein
MRLNMNVNAIGVLQFRAGTSIHPSATITTATIAPLRPYLLHPRQRPLLPIHIQRPVCAPKVFEPVVLSKGTHLFIALNLYALLQTRPKPLLSRHFLNPKRDQNRLCRRLRVDLDP